MPGPFDGTRVQAPDVPDSEQLRPQDLSGLNFFQAPAHAEQNDQLGQLADSLGHFSTEVQRFGHYYSMSQRVHEGGQNKADMDAVQGLVHGHTPQEWQQMVKDGSLPSYASPMAQLYRDRTTGSYTAFDLQKDVQAKIATGELNLADGSAAKYALDQRNQIVQQNGWAPTSGQARGFGESFNSMWNGLQSKQSQAQSVALNEANVDAAQRQVEMETAGAFSSKSTPAQFWAGMNKVRQGLVQGAHFEPKEVDPMIFAALQRRASLDPNWVMAVGQAPRTDLDGKSQLPPLFSKGQYLDQVNSLAERQQKFNVDNENAAQKANINGSVSQLLQADPASIAKVPEQIPYTNKVDGSTGSVAKTEVLHAAVNARITADNQRVASGQATPQQVQDEQLETFAQAGIKQHQWADTLNHAAEGGANFTTLTNPKQKGSVLQAYQLYQDLRTKNPSYLNTLMNDKARKLYDTAFMQQSIFNRDTTTALQEASEIATAPKDEAEAHDLIKQRDEIKQVALPSRGGFLGIGADADVKNPEIATDALTTAAQNLMRLNHMTAQDAVAAAAPYVQKSFVNVNGRLIQGLGYLPQDQMKPAAEKYLSDWASGPAKALNLDPKSLSIAPVGTGRFLIVDAQSGLPISHGQGLSYVTAGDLIQSGKGVQADLAKAQQQHTTDAATAASRVITHKATDRDSGLQWNLDPTQ